MKLYLLEQHENTGYDTYDCCVVIAENEDKARLTNPATSLSGDFETCSYPMWATSADNVIVTYLGEAKKGSEAGEVCASFNAG